MAIDKVTAGVLADDAVTTAKIVNDAVTAAKIPAGAVVADVGTGGIATANLADDAVTQPKIGADAVTATELADNAVVNASVASGAAIALTKLATTTASRVLETSGTGTIQASAVTATEIAKLDGVTATTAELNLVDGSVSGALSHRNMIINGAMEIWQRGTSFPGTGSTRYNQDRFQVALQSLGSYTFSRQAAYGIESEGFGYSLKIDCTTSKASPAATDFFFLNHRIEGQNLQCMRKGTASAKAVTLSFWCRCTKTGNIQVNLVDEDNTRIIAQAVSIDAVNTWQYKTLTFAGDTTGAFGNDRNESLRIEWWLDRGGNFAGGAVPTSWEALSNADRAAGCTLDFARSTDNNFYITGVQLEVGSTATPFEHRGYSEELTRCQRYCIAMCNGATSSQSTTQLFVGQMYSDTFTQAPIQLPTAMRATPSVLSSGNSTFRVYSGSGSDLCGPITIDGPGQDPDAVTVALSVSNLSISGAANRACILRSENSSAFCILEAELV